MSRSEIKRALLDEWRRLRAENPELLPVSIRFSKRMTSKLGSCRFRARKMSDGYFRMMPFEVVVSDSITACGLEQGLDTLRHEAAHAIAGNEARHGPLWKAQARRLGANPKACGVLTAAQREARAAVQPTPRFTITCSKCGMRDTRRRMTARMRSGMTFGRYRHGGACGGVLGYEINERS